MIFLLIIIILFLLYIIRNLYNKNVKLENLVEITENKHVEFLYTLTEKFIQVKRKLDQVDKRGSFASDDEVGFVFKIINNQIIELTNILTELTEDGEKEIGKD